MFPPRPEYVISPEQLCKYEGTHIGQPKLNGSCCEIYIKGDELRYFGRHQNENLSNFKLKLPELKILNFGNDGWNVIVGEYMNKNKNGIDGKPWNHKFVIFDILVYNGDYLIGTTMEERIALLDTLLGTESENDYLYKITDDIYRVKTFYENFSELWKKITEVDMLEGFVLKKAVAKLDRGLAEKNNTLWQLKSRKPTKNYKF
jgi:hypothetical protein